MLMNNLLADIVSEMVGPYFFQLAGMNLYEWSIPLSMTKFKAILSA